MLADRRPLVGVHGDIRLVAVALLSNMVASTVRPAAPVFVPVARSYICVWVL
jgi:hypothetical protein